MINSTSLNEAHYHHLGCILSTSPRAGPSQHGWNRGPNQRRSPHLGGGRSNIPDMHLRAAGVEEVDHQSV
jgi:hypothetical protein